VFAENTNKGLNLLKSKKYLIQNIGINKVDLFVAAALSTLFAFLLNIFVYFIFTAFFDVQFSARLLFVPFLLINLYLICMGVAMILAVLRLFVNDLNHVWDVLLFVGFWSVPIIWNYKYVYETYPWFLYVNPITGILINFRFLVLYDLPIDWSVFAIDYLYGFVLWFIGFWMLKQFSHKAVEFE
jgi:ABC-type polysaccharide/polyol phosphate export permease